MSNRLGMTTKHARKAKPKVAQASKNRPTHSEDGVDLTLIRWFLTLTPVERLEALQEALRSHVELREIFEKSNPG